MLIALDLVFSLSSAMISARLELAAERWHHRFQERAVLDDDNGLKRLALLLGVFIVNMLVSDLFCNYCAPTISRIEICCSLAGFALYSDARSQYCVSTLKLCHRKLPPLKLPPLRLQKHLSAE